MSQQLHISNILFHILNVAYPCNTSIGSVLKFILILQDSAIKSGRLKCCDNNDNNNNNNYNNNTKPIGVFGSDCKDIHTRYKDEVQN